MSSLIVSELYIHPVKSLASVMLDSAWVDEFGLQYDRRWMLVDKQGVFITQRFVPQMCLISAQLNENELWLSAHNMPEISVTETDWQGECRVTVWQDQCRAIDCGDAAANWLSQFLKTDCRLVFFPDDEIRQVDMNYAKAGDKTGFSDGFPLLLIGQASLDDLNKRLEPPVAMQRFRPNLVISGSDAYAEDDWKKIQIGQMTFRVVKPCSRCSIPSINPHTAVREAEPVKTLRSYRLRDNKVYFGQNVIADSTGVIEKGMQVKVLE